MSSYTTSDFSESLVREPEVEIANIEKVLAAWGNVDRDGACCDACGGEWSGGFLMQLKDGRFAYLTGWCDYTGWGCQDGASLTFYTEQPKLAKLNEDISEKSWDLEPSDLNKWLKEDGKLPEQWG